MKCFYINLDQATNRKLKIEENFLENHADGWQLKRFPAVNVPYVDSQKIPGILRSSEKACFLSHQYVVQENLNSNEPIFIMEDDVIFGKKTCEILDVFIKTSNKFEWDILFTDVCIPQPTTMIELVRLRKTLSEKNTIQFLNLAGFPFAGSAAYILNPSSLGKFFNLLNLNDSLDVPYDIYIRQLIYEKKLKGFVTFPFVTTLSNESEISQIQLEGTTHTDLIWNTFRKMIWMDRKIEESASLLEEINRDVCDEESKQFGTVISACISSKFIPK